MSTTLSTPAQLFENEKGICRKPIIIHMFCWAGFIAYEIALLYYSSRYLQPMYIYILYYSLNIGYFYVHVYLLRRTVRAVRPLRFALLIPLFFSAMVALKVFLDGLLTDSHFSVHVQDFEKYLANNIFRTSYFAILASVYWAAGRAGDFRRKALSARQSEMIARQEKTVIEARLNAAQIAYLQQQINPHLLFNVLNFIYNTIYQKLPSAAKPVLLLSEIMRFSYRSTDEQGTLPVADELEQIKNLIEINALRFGGTLNLETEFSGDFNAYRIIPLVLFTLTENIFKHGDLSGSESPSSLKITIKNGGTLTYSSRNKARRPSQSVEHYGLNNIRLRLELAYPGRFLLDTAREGEFFTTLMSIQL
jgi:hypothetical protein